MIASRSSAEQSNTSWSAVFPGKPWEWSSSLSFSSGGVGRGRWTRCEGKGGHLAGWRAGGMAGWLDAPRRGELHAAAARGPGACAHFCFQPSRGADVPIQTTAGRRGRHPRATTTTARDTAPHTSRSIPLPAVRAECPVPSAQYPVPVPSAPSAAVMTEHTSPRRRHSISNHV